MSKSFLFFLSGLSSSLGRGVPSRDNNGGRFFGGSSSFLLGTSSRSAFLFTADVVVSAVTVAVATMGESGSSFESRINRVSLSSEPGRFDAYLNPGPLFCFEAKRVETKRAQLYFTSSEILRFRLIQNKVHTDAYFPCFPRMVALWTLPAVWQLIIDDSIGIFYLNERSIYTDYYERQQQLKYSK